MIKNINHSFFPVIPALAALLCAPLFLTGCGKAGAAPPQVTPGYYQAEYEGETDKGAAFLACGTGGRLDRIFADGTVQNIPLAVGGDKLLTSILPGKDITLVGGTAGTLVYSRGGGEFRAATGAGAENITGLARFKDKYYACAYSGKLLTSADGVSWKAGKQLTAKPLIAIAADDTYIMAITYDTDIFVSKDGRDWTLQNYDKAYAGLATELTFLNLVNLNGNFFIMGRSTDDPNIPNVMFSFSGGEVWSSVVLDKINNRPPDDFYPMTVYSVCSYQGQTMAACDGGRILTITECNTCNKIAEISKAAFRDIASGGDVMLAAGDNFEYKVLDAKGLRQDKISPEQALADIQAGAVIIDVRTDKEYNSGHIPGALHIPVDEIESRLPAEFPERTAELIFYCASGVRSQTALETAQKLGYQDVYNLGGISSWPYDIEQ